MSKRVSKLPDLGNEEWILLGGKIYRPREELPELEIALLDTFKYWEVQYLKLP